MKFFFLSLFISGTSVCAFAQSPTMDFETWTGSDPLGWVSGNAIMILGNPQSVFKETTPANVHGGVNSMKIVTVTLTTNPSPTTIPNPMGGAFPGVINLSPLGLKDGFPYTSRFTAASFWYKYAPTGGDSASCFIMLSRWNGTSRDTIAVGGLVMMAAAAFTQGAISMVYDPVFASAIPDSMRIYFTATCYSALSCGTAGSTLWVDDIAFSGVNGINESISASGVTLFPNPSSDFTTITVEDVNDAYFVEVFDILGNSIISVPFVQSLNGMNKKSAIIPIQGMSVGLYSLSVYDKNKHLLRSGKLNVVK